jgi:hypothetical protein
MTQGLAVQDIYPETSPQAEPQLQLLVERDSGYRIFFGNFRDLIWRRKEPPLFLASQPVHFRRHLSVRTGVHWMVVLESVVWHMAAVPLLLVFWTWSLSWEVRRTVVERNPLARSEQDITYYPLSQSFPAREGRQHENPPAQRSASRKPALQVAEEKRPDTTAAPNVAMHSEARNEMAFGNPTLPAVPIATTSRAQLVLPGDLAQVIGPPADGGQPSLRSAAGPSASVLPPPPQISGGGRSGAISMPVSVVAPAPALQGSSSTRRASAVGDSATVPPSPSLPFGQQPTGRGRGSGALAASGVAVVPPVPLVTGRAYRPGGSGDLIGSTGTQVVPPSPSMGHALVLAGGRGNSLAGAGEQVVPPAPSIRGQSYLAGNGGHVVGGTGTEVVAPSPSVGNVLGNGHGKGNSLGNGAGSGVVPPAPSIGSLSAQGGSGGGKGRGAGLSNGNGEQVIAPAPSLEGTGLGGNGKGFGAGGGNSLLASLGTQAVAPRGMGVGGTGSGLGNGRGNGISGNGSNGLGGTGPGGSPDGRGSGPAAGGGGGTLTVAGLAGSPLAGNGSGNGSVAPIINSAIPEHPETPDLPAGKTQVVPLRVIQLALALPMSSYFSNYEAFVAERAVNRDSTQLIKLVYIFLPYQRRLTEFGIKPSKTFNLRVTRDPTCDESLLSMTWPEGNAGQPPAELNKDKLPCYRTTADDYRRAWEKSH